MEKQFHVYIMASGYRGTLYVGVTSDLKRRVWEHRTHKLEGFTERYGVTQLVWYETFADAPAAITFEKRLKRYRREWKVNRIEEQNPAWNDLYAHLFGLTPRELAAWDDRYPE